MGLLDGEVLFVEGERDVVAGDYGVVEVELWVVDHGLVIVVEVFRRILHRCLRRSASLGIHLDLRRDFDRMISVLKW